MQTLNREDVRKVLERAGFSPDHVIREEFKAREGSEPCVGLRISRDAVYDVAAVARELYDLGELSGELPIDALSSTLMVANSDEGYDVVYFPGFELSPKVEESTGEPLGSEEPADEDRIEDDVNDPEQRDGSEQGPKSSIHAFFEALGLRKKPIPEEALPEGAPKGAEGYNLGELFQAFQRDTADSTVRIIPISSRSAGAALEDLAKGLSVVADQVASESPVCGCGADHFPNLTEREERLLAMAFGYRSVGKVRADEKLVRIGNELLAAFGIE